MFSIVKMHSTPTFLLATGTLIAIAIVGIATAWTASTTDAQSSADTATDTTDISNDGVVLASGVYNYELDGQEGIVHYSKRGRWIQISESSNGNETWLLFLKGKSYAYHPSEDLVHLLKARGAQAEPLTPEPRVFNAEWWVNQDDSERSINWKNVGTDGNGNSVIRPQEATDLPSGGKFKVHEFDADGVKDPEDVLTSLKDDPQTKIVK